MDHAFTCDSAAAVDDQHFKLTLALCQQPQQMVVYLGTLVQLDVAQCCAEQVVADVGKVALVQHVMVGKALDEALLVQGREAGTQLGDGAQVLLDAAQAQVTQSFHHDVQSNIHCSLVCRDCFHELKVEYCTGTVSVTKCMKVMPSFSNEKNKHAR